MSWTTHKKSSMTHNKTIFWNRLNTTQKIGLMKHKKHKNTFKTNYKLFHKKISNKRTQSQRYYQLRYNQNSVIYHNKATLSDEEYNLSTFKEPIAIEPTVDERHKLNFLCVIKPIFCVVFNHFEKHLFLCVIELFLCVVKLIFRRWFFMCHWAFFVCCWAFFVCHSTTPGDGCSVSRK